MAVSAEAAAQGTESSSAAKERLIESALKHFSERGYSATSIREIIEDAGITRPVLYYYFKNKEDLFCHLVESEFDQVCRELDEIVNSPAPWDERVKWLIQRGFTRARRSPEMVRLLLQFFFSPPIEGLHLDREKLGMERFSRIVALMQQGIDAGELAACDPAELALAFGGLVDMHVMATFDDPDVTYTDATADRLVRLFLCGAAPASANR